MRPSIVLLGGFLFWEPGMIFKQELKNLLPPLTPEEYQGLENSIIEWGGAKDAILVWKHGGEEIIIDGHNRHEICSKHNLSYSKEYIHFGSMDEAKTWMIDNQLSRRNLSDGWKFELANAKKDLLIDKGREKISVVQKARHAGVTLSNNDKDTKPHDTRQAIAEELNWSTGKVAQADYVKKESPETWEKVKTGEKTIGGAYAGLKSTKTPEQVKADAKKLEDDIQKELAEKRRKEIESMPPILRARGLYNVVNGLVDCIKFIIPSIPEEQRLSEYTEAVKLLRNMCADIQRRNADG